MKLDLSVIKNESIVKLEKSLKRIKTSFQDMLALALDTAIHEIDPEKRQQVEVVLNDMLSDEFNKSVMSYTTCMNKASEIVETGLNK